MSISNINNIQDNYDLEQLAGFNKEYILQALANLGQRFSVKGDSVSSGEFAFRDIFESSTDEKHSDNYVGRIRKNQQNITFEILNKKTFVVETSESVNNSFNVHIVDSILEMPTKINGVKCYDTNSVIRFDDNNIYTFNIGLRSANTEYDSTKKENTPIELTSFTFNKYNNTLLTGLRMIKMTIKNIVNNTSEDKYIVFYIEKHDNNEYTLRLYKSNKTDKEFCEFCNYLQGNVNNIAKILTPNYILTNVIFKDNSIDISNPLTLTLDENLKIIDSNILSTYVNINTKLSFFKYDEQVFCPFVKDYYTDKTYLVNNNYLKRQIVKSLYNKILFYSTTSSSIYVPLDYIFFYFNNKNNPWQIFGNITDITVKYVNDDISQYTIDDLLNENQLLCATNGSPRVSQFNFIVEYNEDTSNIYGIRASKTYTLPYINGDKYWVIDEVPTEISAKGLNAGNPNIIIVYNKQKTINRGGFEILAGANRENILDNLKWKLRYNWIEPLEKINDIDSSIVTTNDLYKVYSWIPSISEISDEHKEEWINLLKYSLIVSVSSINCFETVTDEIKERYGEYGVVTTLWQFNEEELEFEPILKETPFGNNRFVALDINHLTNLNNMIKWNVKNMDLKHPDKYKHKWLVFDNSYVTLKNSELDYKTYIYGNIVNLTSINFSSMDYKNDLNMFIRYNTNVDGALENDISNIVNNQFNKYIVLNSNNATDVTNSLHTYSLINNKTAKYLEYDINSNVPMLNLSEIFVQNSNIINRSNIIGLDRQGYMFNSYIGSSFDDPDKSNLHIGSSTLNINVGTNTLFSQSDINKFKKTEKLHLDYPNTYINGYNWIQNDLTVSHDIFTNHEQVTVKKPVYDKNSRYNINNIVFTPISKFVFQTDKTSYNRAFCTPLQFNNGLSTIEEINIQKSQTGNLDVTSMINTQIKQYYTNYNYLFDEYHEDDVKLWVPALFYFKPDRTNNKARYLYLYDMIFIPSLLYKLRLYDFCDTSVNNIEITSNQEIIYGNGHPLFMKTNNRFIKNIANIEVSSEVSGFEFEEISNEIFIGNDLQITYYISKDSNQNKKLHITINELCNSQKINNLYAIKTNYTW